MQMKTNKAKKVVKWIGLSFVGLFLILLILPYFFKNEIKELVLKEVNKTLNAELSMGDFDLTFIRTFPNMTIELNDTKVVGTGDFKGVELANIKQFSAHVGFWSVVSGEQVEIDEIHLVEPSFDVRILKDGKANYDIVKPDSLKTPEEISEPSSFKLSLKKYTITNAMVKYDDKSSNMFAQIDQLNHEGAGDLTAETVDFQTKTTMEKLSFKMDGINYLSEVKTEAIANLLMEMNDQSSKFTLKENTFKLNALTFSLDGFYEMLTGYDQMDLKLNASKATFKDFLSLVPTFYHSGYESMLTKGNLAMGGFVKGRMDEENMPGWDFNISVDQASVRYPDLPGSIQHIQLKAGSKFEGGKNMDLMTLDVEKFHADFAGNTIDAMLKMRNPMTDPFLQSTILAKVDLATLKKVIPLSEGESYTGKLNADVRLKGRMSAIENENYEAFDASGTIGLKNMVYASKEVNDKVDIAEMVFRFSPKNLALEKLDGKTGNSDFSIRGSIDNYMGYVFREELLKGTFSFTANKLDLDQLMNLVPSEEGSDKTDTVKTNETENNPIAIPSNVDFVLQTSIANVRYNNMDIKQVNGTVELKEAIATLENLTMQTMGGTVGLKGKFNTVEPSKPVVDFAYSLKEIDIKELASNFLTIQKLAPIAAYANGKISSDFAMKSALTSNLDPIYSSLSGVGDFATKSITISGFKPMEKVSETLNIRNFSNQTIKDLKTKFKFADGKVSVMPFQVNLGKIKTTVSGSTSFEQAIDYTLKMLIPKEEIPGEILKTAEQAIAKLNALAPKLNVQSLPDFLPVTVLLGGTVLQPKITSNYKEAILEATGNKKDQLINAVKETVKDTVKAIVGEKIKEVKEDLMQKKQQLLDEAQTKVTQLNAEAKKAADLLRSEAQKQSNELMKQAGANPLKQKAAEIAGVKIKKEAEEKALKIEREAQQRSTNIMATAREKADALK